MRKKKLKKVFIVIFPVIFLILLWYFFSNPASIIKNSKIKYIGLYSLQDNRSLWDLGYNPDDFTEAPSQYGDFKFNAVLKGNALNRVLESLSAPGKSYYIFHKNNNDYQGLYVINISMSENEGFTFFINDFDKSLNGKFLGYRYNNGRRIWILYENAKLGKTLEELRTK